MSRIHRIPPEVAERIAAGEVVDRPTSVIKELMENSLDAGATLIEVELEEGGQALMRVTDDGVGMTAEEAALAVERHATSKLRAWEDLGSLTSFGFRGEALPSVAAVSRFEMNTTPRGGEVGTRITMHGPGLPKVEAAPGPAGTSIEVRDLFWNTPARRKFLKSASGETARMTELVSRFAILNPSAGFRLIVNGREQLYFAPELSLAERLGLHWKVPPDQIVELDTEVHGLRIFGALLGPDHHRRNRSQQILAVNGRLIVSASLSQALSEGFDPLLPRGRHPVAYVDIGVDPSEVDVNIHPTKSEVRFADDRAPFRAVYRAVSEALERRRSETVVERHWEATLVRGGEPTPPPRLESAQREPLPLVTNLSFLEADRSAEKPVKPVARGESFAPYRGGDTSKVMQLYEPPSTPPTTAAPAHGSDQYELEAVGPVASRPTYLTSLYGSYLVMKVEGQLWVIDQHAAHERINYERLHRYQVEGPDSQHLLIPEALPLSGSERDYLLAHSDQLREIGFDWQTDELGEVELTAVPPGLKPGTEGALFCEVVRELYSEEVTVTETTLARYREAVRAMMACKSSVRARESVRPEEAVRLTEDLLEAERSPYCPHGRPTRIRLDQPALERLFHRH